MPKISESQLTPQQRKWFASVKAGLETSTGRSLQEWTAIARTCPETQHRARLRWFKDTYGLMQNRASYVLAETFPDAESAGGAAAAAREALWAGLAERSVLEALEGAMAGWPDLVVGQRKAYTAFSRRYQFAAARPARGGLELGLALVPEADGRLAPAGRAPWSERLAAKLRLADVADALSAVDLLRAAYQRS